MKNINLKLEMSFTFTKVLMLAAAAPYLLAVDFMAFLCDLAKSTKTKTTIKFGTVFLLIAVVAIHFAESLLSESNEIIFEIIKIAFFMLKGMSLNIVGTAIKIVSANWVLMNVTIFITLITATIFKVAPFIQPSKQKNNYESGMLRQFRQLPDHSYLNQKKNVKGCFGSFS